jgi:peptidoglycan/xylan/chitin deacetylase (PgdA/CDA1 family)
LSERIACFTVDVDCDVAWHCEGKKHAVTRGQEKAFFDASREGLISLVDLLNELGTKATFFFEARTAVELNKCVDLKQLMEGHEVGCHGLEHEDFTGALTCVKMSRGEKKQDILTAKAVLEKIFGRRIKGFRAPYLNCDDELLGVLAEAGFEYDSSLVNAEGILYKTSGLTEVPLLAGSNGKPLLYFWKMMEGKESAEEFLEKASGKTFLLLATHSWHLVKKANGTRADVEGNKRVVRKVLENVASNAVFETLEVIMRKGEINDFEETA